MVRVVLVSVTVRVSLSVLQFFDLNQCVIWGAGTVVVVHKAFHISTNKYEQTIVHHIQTQSVSIKRSVK